jgi:hypothetical protein
MFLEERACLIAAEASMSPLLKGGEIACFGLGGVLAFQGAS